MRAGTEGPGKGGEGKEGKGREGKGREGMGRGGLPPGTAQLRRPTPVRFSVYGLTAG